MAKPSLLCVDDDPDVLRAIQRDLRSQYGHRYRVLRANSGEEAMGALRQLKERDDLTGPDLLRAGAAAWHEDREPYLLETSVPGVFAVGDVRASSVKRVASAVGEGSIAVSFIHQYLATR